MMTRTPSSAALRARLDDAARFAAEAREAEASLGDTSAGTAERAGLQSAARGFRRLAAHSVAEAGRIAARSAR